MGNSLSASLLVAARSGNVNAIKQLKQQGADLNALFEDDKTILHVAAEEGKDDVVDLLISLGASVSSVDKHKYIPLHNAVFMGHINTVRLLIEKGSDVNSVDNEGMSPLHWAVKRGHFDIVQLLIKTGADTNIKNSKGDTPVDAANKFKPRRIRHEMQALIAKCIEGNFDFVKAPVVSAAEGLRLSRLDGLCRVWGLIKYAHPSLPHKLIDWDRALLKAIPLTSSGDYKVVIDQMLQELGDHNTYSTTKQGKDQVKATILTQNEPLTFTISSTVGYTDEQQRSVSSADPVGIVTITDYSKLQDFSKVKLFVEVFTEARVKCKSVIFDLRSNVSDNDLAISRGLNASGTTVFLKQMFYEAFRIFLNEPLPLPAQRTRVYRGHHMEWNRYDSDNYFEGTFTSDGEVLLPPPQQGDNSVTATEPTPKMVFIVNLGTPACLIDVVSSLQCKGLAVAIQVVSSGATAVVECGIPVTTIEILDISIHIRTLERINFNNTIGFIPDLVTSAKDDNNEIEKALSILRHCDDESVFTAPRAHMVANAYIPRPVAKEYSADKLEREERLLALFKFWNIVEFFYPYKSQTLVEWGTVLRDFIPKLESASSPLVYSLAIAELVACLRDTHAYASSPILNEHIGTHVPQLVAQFIEGHTVVTYIGADLAQSLKSSDNTERGIHIGDIILSIDGVDVSEARESLARISPASTRQAREWRVDQILLAGKANSSVSLEVKGVNPTLSPLSSSISDSLSSSGTLNESIDLSMVVRQVVLPRTVHPSALVAASIVKHTAVYGVIGIGIGYIDTTRLDSSEVEVNNALEAIRDQPCLILDVRGFPRDSLQKIVASFTCSPTEVLNTYTPFHTSHTLLQGPVANVTETVTFYGNVHSRALNYQGKIVILVNEKTASSAEQHLLYLERVCENKCGGVTYVGSPTNGCIGKMTNVKLPGDVFVGMSGVGAKTIHGKCIQGVGIIPQVAAEPTISGVLAEADEVLSKAVDYCKSYLQPNEATTSI